MSTDGKQVHRCVLESWTGLADRYITIFNTFSMKKLGFVGDVEIKLWGISIQGKFRFFKLVRSNLEKHRIFHLKNCANSSTCSRLKLTCILLCFGSLHLRFLNTKCEADKVYCCRATVVLCVVAKGVLEGPHNHANELL
jgi:hypothetical protein